MEKLFYLTSRHGNCGDNVMFHNKNGAGYGTDLDGLRLYTIEKAQEELNHDIRSLPLLKSAVDAVSITAVDCQYIDNKLTVHDQNDEYVVQIKQLWNGNDIAFAVMGGHTFDYGKASVLSLDDAQSISGADTNIWAKSYLDKICRRTFQEQNINTRKMITCPGIKYKKPRKPRPTSGKERWNCPSCGRISWQYNPYDFEGCNDYSCKEWRFN